MDLKWDCGEPASAKYTVLEKSTTPKRCQKVDQGMEDGDKEEEWQGKEQKRKKEVD
jgi:hypothetical protein